MVIHTSCWHHIAMKLKGCQKSGQEMHQLTEKCLIS